MQDIKSVYDWRLIPVGEAMVITSDLPHQRVVRIKVNAPGPRELYVQQDDIVEPLFLARVEGLDVVQFNVIGSYKLIAIGGDIYLDTLDGSRPDVEPVEPASFTNIIERQARNPELELMELKLRENADRRFAAMQQSMMAALEEKDAQLAAARKDTSGVDTEKSAQLDPPSALSEPVEPPTGGDGGTSEDE